MSGTDTGVLDEALERLHRAGPERDGWLSNHAPMAVEALVRHGHGASAHRWLERYALTKLEDMPRSSAPVPEAEWREALGDPRRLGDWTVYFGRAVVEEGWRPVLVRWWPRLLPGIVAGATHPVIRVGHAVRALLEYGENAARVTELAHGLAYWAGRHQPLAGVARPSGAASPGEALAAVPRVGPNRGGIRERLALLGSAPGWTGATASLRAPAGPREAQETLAELVTAATGRFAVHAHGDPVMLVHAATAPNAVLRTLPALPRELWEPSLRAAWAASAAVTAVYATPAAEVPRVSGTGEELFARAVEHGDEHVIKLADTALDVAARSGNGECLVAVEQALRLIGPPDA
ncbi:questin oxidase family protein [Streptomyces abyssomicinicus]|uniref:questin oxidase family protein n=1 Tax=Streptomyces abyssomicinicus TaxID=574929 RepID=UPI001250A7B3|nr:questin oxidase family protein [Streptomyces abyssomicinicus]